MSDHGRTGDDLGRQDARNRHQFADARRTGDGEPQHVRVTVTGSAGAGFPLSAVVGAEEAKLALILAAADRNIGGVLLRGHKGSAKSTLARGLAALLDGGPFVELPLGATEERVVGSLDLGAALTGGEVRFKPGLLAAADGGVLYVDEVNLLADHLVDALLDAAASGVNRVERDGVSHSHPARFLLVGSMNPEEGDLRPQLLDRFGLAVDVRNPTDPATRAEVVRRRQAFDADPSAFVATWSKTEDELVARLARTRPATVDDDLLEAACATCVAAGAESMRADIVLARAASAHAGWQGGTTTTADDVRAVAHLVLAHRQRRQPLDDPAGARAAVDDALDDALGDGALGDGATEPPEDHVAAPDPPPPVIAIVAPKSEEAGRMGRRSPVGDTERGRTVGSRAPVGAVGAVAVVPTIQAAAVRRAEDAGATPAIVAADLREPVKDALTGNLLVLAVDASGSMGTDDRMAAVKGALLGLLVDAYQRRDRVALVTFGGNGAEVVLRPTGSVEVARARLESLATGGETPLAEGIKAATVLAHRSATPNLRPLLVVVTDGRATSGAGVHADPVAAALAEAAIVARHRLPAVVIDVEPATGPRLGLAADLAAAMGARHLALPDLTAGRLESALRHL
ncbi:MAG: magnesium chelatase subunit [Actinomycetota bacterium]|nr:magnesium chelatase subunit [Actinomycetota bacterium]